MDFKIQRSSGHCTATGRELKQGEVLFSALIETAEGLERLDYSEEGWSGPPTEAIAFWKGRVPLKDQPRHAVGDPETLLHLFERLEEKGDTGSENLRYLLALLLARKRLFRLGNVEESQSGEVVEVTCTQTQNTYRVRKPELSEEQMEELEGQLAHLMETGAD